ncbi:MAG: hypothetical protein GY953_09275 [bacterium]|nr:hypothetical protein [bacterium]
MAYGFTKITAVVAAVLDRAPWKWSLTTSRATTLGSRFRAMETAVLLLEQDLQLVVTSRDDEVATADHVLINLQLRDRDGNDVAAQKVCEVAIFNGAMVEQVAAAFACSASIGTGVSTTGQGRLIFTTTAAGVAQIDVFDVAGASGADINSIYRIHNAFSRSTLESFSFN